MLCVFPVWRHSFLIQQVFFIAHHSALLASPAVTIKHGLPGACRIKGDAKHLAAFSQRRCQCRPGGGFAGAEASRKSRPMFPPPMIPITFGAAIFALVLPMIFCDVLHTKLSAALWILAHQRRRIRALFAAVPATVSHGFLDCHKRLAAEAVGTNQGNALAPPQVHACRRAECLGFSVCRKILSAMLAHMPVDSRSCCPQPE